MGSFLPIILHIFSILFPSPSVFFFPTPSSLALTPFLFLSFSPSLPSFSFPLFSHSHPFSRLTFRPLLLICFPVSFPSFSFLFPLSALSFFSPCHVSVMPPLPHPPWAPFSLLITFFPSSPSIPPSSTPSLLSLLPSFPTSLTLAYHAVFFCTPRLFLLKPCECMLVHSLLNSIAAAWWHEAI